MEVFDLPCPIPNQACFKAAADHPARLRRVRQEACVCGSGRIDRIAIGIEDGVAVRIKERGEARSEDRADMRDPSNCCTSGCIKQRIRRHGHAQASAQRREPVQFLIVPSAYRGIEAGKRGVAACAGAEMDRGRALGGGGNVRFNADEPNARLPVVAAWAPMIAPSSFDEAPAANSGVAMPASLKKASVCDLPKP